MTADQKLTEAEELSLGADFASAEDLEDDAPDKGKKLVPAEDGEQEEPSMSDPAWSDFVLKHFEEDELDPDGRPVVHGLRRVARLLLGPIVRSEAKVVQAPSLLSGLEKLGFLQPATVEYAVEILMCRDLDGGMEPYHARFADAADVYHGNTDPDYARHATATASTRAEARCLRKALGLKGIAGEEKTLVPSVEAALDGMITPDQVNFLGVLCRRNDINVMKFVNSGKKKYDSVYDVEAGVAAKMVEYLAGVENSGKAGESIRGYDPKWKG